MVTNATHADFRSWVDFEVCFLDFALFCAFGGFWPLVDFGGCLGWILVKCAPLDFEVPFMDFGEICPFWILKCYFK